jgi:hypothetical protein
VIPKRVAFSWLVKGHSDSPHRSYPLGLEPVGLVEVFIRNGVGFAKKATDQSAALKIAPDRFVVFELPGEGLRVGADAFLIPPAWLDVSLSGRWSFTTASFLIQLSIGMICNDTDWAVDFLKDKITASRRPLTHAGGIF